MKENAYPWLAGPRPQPGVLPGIPKFRQQPKVRAMAHGFAVDAAGRPCLGRMDHVAHKVPSDDGLYSQAKYKQVVQKKLDEAEKLFIGAIETGDRVDSALKDLAVVYKQQNREPEAILAIEKYRSFCSESSQESIDNVLLDLYKKSGMLDAQIALLNKKLDNIREGRAFKGKRTKTARSQGKKFQVSIEQEESRLLGNLGWALMQSRRYAEAEIVYRQALSIQDDSNKVCNLAICLLYLRAQELRAEMREKQLQEARFLLHCVAPDVDAAIVASYAASTGVNPHWARESHLKSFFRAYLFLRNVEDEEGLQSDPRQLWRSPMTSSTTENNNGRHHHHHAKPQGGAVHPTLPCYQFQPQPMTLPFHASQTADIIKNIRLGPMVSLAAKQGVASVPGLDELLMFPPQQLSTQPPAAHPASARKVGGSHVPMIRIQPPPQAQPVVGAQSAPMPFGWPNSPPFGSSPSTPDWESSSGERTPSMADGEPLAWGEDPGDLSGMLRGRAKVPQQDPFAFLSDLKDRLQNMQLTATESAAAAISSCDRARGAAQGSGRASVVAREPQQQHRQQMMMQQQPQEIPPQNFALPGNNSLRVPLMSDLSNERVLPPRPVTRAPTQVLGENVNHMNGLGGGSMRAGQPGPSAGLAWPGAISSNNSIKVVSGRTTDRRRVGDRGLGEVTQTRWGECENEAWWGRAKEVFEGEAERQAGLRVQQTLAMSPPVPSKGSKLSDQSEGFGRNGGNGVEERGIHTSPLGPGWFSSSCVSSPSRRLDGPITFLPEAAAVGDGEAEAEGLLEGTLREELLALSDWEEPLPALVQGAQSRGLDFWAYPRREM